jgi:hypothetical protein
MSEICTVGLRCSTFPFSLTTIVYPQERVVVVSIGTQYDPYDQEGVPLGDLATYASPSGESWVEIISKLRRGASYQSSLWGFGCVYLQFLVSSLQRMAWMCLSTRLC